MIETKIFATFDLASLEQAAPPATGPDLPSPRPADADLTVTPRASAEGTAAVAPRAVKPAPRLLLETSLVPVEELLARHGVSNATGAQASRAPQNAPADARGSENARGARARRRILIPAIASLLFIAVAMCLRLAGHASNDAIEPKTLASRDPRPSSLMRARDRRAVAPAPPAPSGNVLRVSLDRAASDAVIEGRYEAAADTYERLAQATPARPVYREAARILRQRLATTKNH